WRTLCPTATPREISSRSAQDSPRALRRRGTGVKPPYPPGSGAPPCDGDRVRGRSRATIRPGALVATPRPGPQGSGHPAISVAASLPPALALESMMLRRPIECTIRNRVSRCPSTIRLRSRVALTRTEVYGDVQVAQHAEPLHGVTVHAGSASHPGHCRLH